MSNLRHSISTKPKGTSLILQVISVNETEDVANKASTVKVIQIS